MPDLLTVCPFCHGTGWVAASWLPDDGIKPRAFYCAHCTMGKRMEEVTRQAGSERG